MVARLMKYGKQQWSDIMAMGLDDFFFAFEGLMDLVGAENEAAKADETPAEEVAD